MSLNNLISNGSIPLGAHIGWLQDYVRYSANMDSNAGKIYALYCGTLWRLKLLKVA